jgi:chromosome segregation ATPase
MSDLTTIRKMIRAEGQKAEGYALLDAMLGDVADLNKLVIEKQNELDKVTAALADARAGNAAALAERDAIIAAAQERADTIIAGANAQDARANADRQEAEHQLANARQQAAALVEQGRADGEKAAREADGRLTALNTDIANAESRLRDLEAETSAATAQRDAIAADIAALRAKLG